MPALPYQHSDVFRISATIVVCLVFFVGFVAGTAAAAPDGKTITVTDNPTTETEVSDIHSALDHVADGGDIHIDASYDPAAEPELPIVIDQPVTITSATDDLTTINTPAETQKLFEITSSDVVLSSLEITSTDDANVDSDAVIATSEAEPMTDITLTDIVVNGTPSTGFAAYTSVDELTIHDSQFSHQGERAIVVDSAVDVEFKRNTVAAGLSVEIADIRPDNGGISIRDNTFATDTDLTVVIDSATDDIDAAVIADNEFSSSTHMEVDMPDCSTGELTLAPNWWGHQYGPDITTIAELTNPQHALSPDRNAATLSVTNATPIEVTPWYADQNLTTAVAPVENADQTYLGIQEAVDGASAEDEIQIHAGEFHSSVTVDSPVTLSGTSNHSLIRGAVNIATPADGADATLGTEPEIQMVNLRFNNSESKCGPVISAKNIKNKLYVKDCTIQSCYTPIVDIESESYVEFNNNLVRLTETRSDTVTDAPAIDIIHDSDIHISSNDIVSLRNEVITTGVSVTGTADSYISDNNIKNFSTGLYLDTGFSQISSSVFDSNHKALHTVSTARVVDSIFASSHEKAILAKHDRSLRLNGNWWNSTNGPGGVGEGDGDPIINKGDGEIELYDFATVVDVGNISPEIDFLGIERDPVAESEQAINFTGQNITYDPRDTGEPRPASGVIVIEIAGVEFTGELDSGSISNLTIDDPTESFDAADIDSGEVDITIPHTDLGPVDSITLLHEAHQSPESGYVPVSIPQPSAVYFDQTDPHTVTWNASIEEYQSVDLPINTGDIITGEPLNNGFYFHLSDANTRYGFSYATEPTDDESSINVSLEDGWNLVSTNYDVSSSNTVSVNQDLSGIEVSDSDTKYGDTDVVAYTVDSAKRLYADSTISSYSLYWIYVEDGATPVDRSIQTPVYDPDPGG
ncbi:hypothetical protein K0C01_03000 [Salinarchaeum sp. IM2453]|uniref:hypothetical protein n=1 Tax=Salinarchaeum sp. IM2453 TaxID=2862870 RepID=UPI001C82F694|nr:hypothetical protein [Salinarchaeum sp. IM2453]QZA89136.1 hypothetical protein K0C01_03000 [Salinarchaeum sp. IM2453]